MTPLSNADAFLKVNPRAQRRTIDQSGIIPYAERPEEFNSLVRGWLKHHESENEDIVERAEQEK